MRLDAESRHNRFNGFLDDRAEQDSVNAAARALDVRLLNLVANETAGFEAAFAAAAQQRCDGIVLSGEAIFLGNLSRLVALASQYRAPAWEGVKTCVSLERK